MKHLPLRECGYAIGFVVLLAAIYVGGYFLAVTPRAFAFSDGADIELKPAYPAEWMKSFFAPVHSIDRNLRPDVWTIHFRF